jgi:hypothetical protein
MTVTGAFVTESVERAINEGFGNDIAPLIAFRTVRAARLDAVAPALASDC